MASKKTGKTKKPPTVQEFCAIWRRIHAAGGTLQEVSAETGYTRRQCTTKAYALRKKDVDLGEFTAAGPRIDYSTLKAS